MRPWTLTRLWLDGYARGCHGRMGWVVAMSDWCARGVLRRSAVTEYIDRHPLVRRFFSEPSSQ